VIAKALRTHPLFKTQVIGIKHLVHLRIRTTDVTVLKQVLLERHYEIPFHITPKVIVDAGANIGLSAIFFANKYPDATIIALEPELTNFELLQKNAFPYPNIKPLRAALWKDNRQINLIDPDCGHHGFQIMDGNLNNVAQCGLVQALTLDAVMERLGIRTVDLLKIDIEGAEMEVFQNSERWIDRVEVIMAELHDHEKPGCSEAFMEATKSFSQKFTNGEIVMRLRTAVTEQINN
jgi:FkbM family methyltransferase